jgi:nucleoside-diphosphate-sugar epimerase
MSKKIVITGANGFIGNYLTEYLAKNGNEIYGLVHHLYKAPPQNITFRAFDLNSFGSDVIPQGTEIIIHAAYIPNEKNQSSEDINYKATKRLYEIGKRKGVKLFIFLSSFSASENAISEYGKSKFITSKIFDKSDSLILEPGLVIGNGGLHKRITDVIKQSSIIPLIGNGKQILQYILMEDLAKVIEKSIDNNINGAYRIAVEQNILMKDFYKSIAKDLNKKIIFVPLPYFIADIIFGLSESLKINIGISKDSYLGLKLMKKQKIVDSMGVFKVVLKTI